MEQKLWAQYQLQTGHNGVIEIADVGRDDLAKFIAEMGTDITGAEIGVAAGQYSETLMEANPNMTLYGVDPWEPYPTYKDYVKESTFNQLFTDTHMRVDRFPNYKFVRKYSMDAVNDFTTGQLDFVYIDANHSEPYVSQDITEWAKKVKKGGIVSGHDYARIRRENGESSKNWAVIPALDEYRKNNPIRLYIWGLNAKNGLKRDSARSWMFFKD